MEDIFITDPRQASAKQIARSGKAYKKNKRNFRQYIADLLIKSLLLFSFVALDFTLFAQSGEYSLFTLTKNISPDAVLIYLILLITSFALIFLFSFSLTLQNFILSATLSLVFLALLNQFLLFNPESILLPYAEHFGDLGEEILGYFSHYILASALFIISFILFTYIGRKTQFYITLIVLGIICFCSFEVYQNPAVKYSRSGLFLNEESTHPDSRNIVYIALTEAPTYTKLKSFVEHINQQEVRQAADNVLGFYQKNNFIYYPNSYIKYIKQPYMNLLDTLNHSNPNGPEDILLSNLVTAGYWDFSSLNSGKIHLQKNQLFDDLHKKDINLRIYQNQDIELCSINNNLSVNRCQTRSGMPFDFSETDFTTEQKASLLAVQWLESTGFISNINPLLGLISAFERSVTPLHFSAKQLQTYNSLKYLDMIATDIKTDRGNNIYIAILNFPGNLYIYDSFCNIKPLSSWVDAKDNDVNINIRKKAMAEQTNCLYGQLEKFVQELRVSQKIKQTSIIIQGLDNVFGSTPGIEKDFLKSMQETKQAGLAIYNPLDAQNDIDNRFCSASSIINAHLNKSDNCVEFQDISLAEQLKKNTLQSAEKNRISHKEAVKSQNNFQNWYQSWATSNQVDNLDQTSQIPLEKTPTSPEQEEKEIAIVPVAEVIEDLPPEEKTKPLPAMAIEENILTDTNQDKENEVIAKPVSEETTLPINPPKEKELSIEKNEEPKAEVETKQEIKHIDNNSDNTVVPSQENKETATSSDVVTKDSTTSEEAPKNKEIKSSDEAKPQTTTETKSQKVTTSNSKMLKPELLKEQFKEKMASKSLPEEKTNNNAINIEVKVIDKELDRSQDI